MASDATLLGYRVAALQSASIAVKVDVIKPRAAGAAPLWVIRTTTDRWRADRGLTGTDPCLMEAMHADPHAALDLIDRTLADRGIQVNSRKMAERMMAAVL